MDVLLNLIAAMLASQTPAAPPLRWVTARHNTGTDRQRSSGETAGLRCRALSGVVERSPCGTGAGSPRFQRVAMIAEPWPNRP